MALRSLSRTPAATSGPGRGPGSDGRTSSDGRASDGRARYGHARRRAARRRHASSEARAEARALRLRAESLFLEAGGEAGAGVAGRRSGAGEQLRGVSAPQLPSVPQPQPQPQPQPPPVFRPRGRSHPRPQVHTQTHPQTLAHPVDSPRMAPPAQPEATADGGEVGPPLRGRVGLALRERLPLWLQMRCGLERRSLVALVVVLVLAAVFAAQHFWAGRTQPVRAPDVVEAAPERGVEPSPSPGASPPAGGHGPSAPGTVGAGVVVDVSGKVRSPGILRLPAGSRVADALKAAGGVRPGADTDGLNRARLLVDGEQVAVGAPAAPGPAAPGAAAAGATGASPAAPVGLNTATAEQLDELPGVGPVLAQHIIDYRTEHGGFRSVDELREVNGIGDRRFADLQNLVRP
ncbi:helix-hairpin-helix domain-containing protein [Streptomyces sp. NPDC048436]|uniref:helix-hairpin-helix domain-containing protein n=1 Tax=Streptomyces sp. NPDC048436 TaxID=3365550 RepID=UPI00371B35E7